MTLVLALPAVAAAQVELSGFVAAEGRLFFHPPSSSGIDRDDASLILQPELFWESGDRRHSALFVPFLRLNTADPQRTHFDVRELIYHRYEPRWELRAGMGRVFWGVTESRHLVDVINQTDLVEDIDGEDKLGQPMLNLTLKGDWGALDAFVLPGFRERTFPGRHGRVRSIPFVDADAAIYESGAEQRRVDLALRFSTTAGDWDLGLAHFHGTSREPELLLRGDGAGDRFIPRYSVIHRTSLDLQATRGAMLWKLEALLQSGQGPTHIAWVAGGEYTLFGIGDSRVDLGLLLEHLMDGRGDQAPNPFQNDVFLGARLVLNDEWGSELLAGVIEDLSAGGRLFSVEASRRLSDRWTAELEMRFWSGIPRGRILSPLAREDYLQFTLNRYF